MLSLCYGGERHGQRDKLPGLDNDRRGERRPGGQAAAGRRVGEVAAVPLSMRINMYVEELTERGLEVVSVMLGQGLTDQVDLIDKTLREGSPIMEVKTFDDASISRRVDGCVRGQWRTDEPGPAVLRRAHAAPAAQAA